MKETLKQAVLAVETKYAFKFCDAQGVQEKAIRGAIQQYAKDVRPEDVLLLMDTTLFSSGKEGFLLTSERLYASFFRQKPQYLELKQLKRAELAPGAKDKVACTDGNGNTRVYYASIYAPYIASVLTAVIGVLTQAPAAPAEQRQMSPLEQAIAQRLAAKKEAERKEAQKQAAPL